MIFSFLIGLAALVAPSPAEVHVESAPLIPKVDIWANVDAEARADAQRQARLRAVAEAAIAGELLDPESARFEWPYGFVFGSVGKDIGYYTCGRVNARNRFGGYVGRRPFFACSARKRTDTGELSALARYDGPAWRTLRANLTCVIEPPLALSAEYGLISAYQTIPNYNRRLDAKRAAELVDPVAEQLVALIRCGKLRGETFVYGGQLYRDLLEQSRQLAQMELRRDIPLAFARGPIGRQLEQLKAFLLRPPVMVPAIVDELEEGGE